MKEYACSFFVTITLLIFGLGAAWADEAGVRPLRTVPPQPSQLPSSSLHIINSALQPNNFALVNSYTISQPLTQMYVRQYTNPGGIAYLNTMMERANIYMPFIREEVKNRRLPPELMFLPAIESSFVITARSRSGAVGLWQFMLNSISPFDIRVTDYIDERRDFIKSTRGALQKLNDNYRTLGCWKLALAAYNSGLGSVSRTIQRTGIRDYWILSEKNELRQETVHYVQKLIAAT
jgi:membrane-bound lytic murein transglycosylase D